MINIVSNKNNNQVENKILNITILIKNQKLFYVYFESAWVMKLILHTTAIWMLEKIDQPTKSDLKKVQSIVTNIFRLECAV